MDVEFHYYMTYLIASRAGFGSKEARVISYSSQYTDDNCEEIDVLQGCDNFYRNNISQTMDITKPAEDLQCVYCFFHFLPGDPDSYTARRKDGRVHPLNTTPNSANANIIFDEALKTDNLYRIGIATHMFADTWAHQNFVGCKDEFNMVGGIGEIPIGHAPVNRNPDIPGLQWIDQRLVDENSSINNTDRFVEASQVLFTRFRKYIDPSVSKKSLINDAEELRLDIKKAIGMTDIQSDKLVSPVRIRNYRELGILSKYGGSEIPDYDESDWIDDACSRKTRGLIDRSNLERSGMNLRGWVIHCKDKINYQDYDWFRFQEAVREHIEVASKVLEKTFQIAKEERGIDLSFLIDMIQ